MTSTSPDPSRTTPRDQVPAAGTPSPVYPDQGTAGAAPVQPTDPALTETAPATTEPPVQRTRAASFWVSVVVTALILIALIIFLAQNNSEISIHFLWLEWPHLPGGRVAHSCGVRCTAGGDPGVHPGRAIAARSAKSRS